VSWLERLTRDSHNVELALSWALEARETELFARLAAATFRFWHALGRMREARAWLDEAGEQTAGLRTAVRANVLRAAGGAAWHQGDADRLLTLAPELVSICRELGDRHMLAQALGMLGLARFSMGDTGAARTLYEEALGHFRELGDHDNVAVYLTNLADLALS